MALSDKDYTELQSILQALQPNLNNVYQRGQDFIRDQIDREAKYGQDMFMSVKQFAWLRKLNDEFGEKPPMQGRTAGKMTESDDPEDDLDSVPF